MISDRSAFIRRRFVEHKSGWIPVRILPKGSVAGCFGRIILVLLVTASVTGAFEISRHIDLRFSPICNVVFENCTIHAGKSGFVLRNVKDVDLSGLAINVPEGVKPVVRR